MLAERGPLRVGLTVVTLILGFLMLVQSVVARLVSGSPGADEIAALGAIMAVPWLLSGMLVGPAPRYAAALLCLAGAVGVADRAAPLDLRVWGGIAFLLALLCLGASMAEGRTASWTVPAGDGFSRPPSDLPSSCQSPLLLRPRPPHSRARSR